MKKLKKQQEELLAQAFLEIAQEQNAQLEQRLQVDPGLAHQADVSYLKNRQRISDLIRKRKQASQRLAWPALATALSLALLLAITLRLTAPVKDLVSGPSSSPQHLDQVVEGSGTPEIQPSNSPAPVPPTQSPQATATATPSPTTTPAPTATPSPAATPTTEVSPSPTVAVPTWTGKFYPAQLPAGFAQTNIQVEANSVQAVFSDAQGRQLVFTEYAASTILPLNQQGMEYRYLGLHNGQVALVASGPTGASVCWDVAGSTLLVHSPEGEELALQLANAVAPYQ